jgi:hypothetical protein
MNANTQDAFELIRNGVLPEWVAQLWKRHNWFDPRVSKWLSKHHKLIETTLFITMMGCIATVINGIKTTLPLAVLLICGGFIVITIVGMWHYYKYHELWDRRLHGFQPAIIWLFEVKPMSRDEFPVDERAFKKLYLGIMIDLARIVRWYETTGKADAYEAEMARGELHSLFAGARGFGFIENPKKKLGLFYELANASQRFIYLDAHRWIKNAEKRAHNDPYPFGTARALYKQETPLKGN